MKKLIIVLALALAAATASVAVFNPPASIAFADGGCNGSNC